MLLLAIFAFPLIVAGVYGAAFTLAFMLRQHSGIASVSRWAPYLYPMVLGCLFIPIIVVVVQRGMLSSLYLDFRSPSLFQWLFIVIASLFTGVALFYGEKIWNGFLIRRSKMGRSRPNSLDWKVNNWFPLLSLITVPMEEIIWRGYLFRELQSHLGLSLILCIFIVSFTFSLHHYFFGPLTMIYKAFSSVIWLLLVLSTGQLLAAIIAHLVSDQLTWRQLSILQRS